MHRNKYYALVYYLYVILLCSSLVCPDQECHSNHEQQIYEVQIDIQEPLGLRLGNNLEIVEFVHGRDGESRALENSGLVEIGDRILSVNGVNLQGKPILEAADAIRSANTPKIIKFLATDGRCYQIPRVVDNSETDQNRNVIQADNDNFSPGINGAGYIVVKHGIHTIEKLHAIQAEYGVDPTCDSFSIVRPHPLNACSPITNNIREKYVFVPSTGGCSLYQKAMLIQEAGGAGVIFGGIHGQKVKRLQKPKDKQDPQIPVTMTTYSSAQILNDLMQQSNKIHPSAKISTTLECLRQHFAHVPDHSIHQLVENIKALAGDLYLKDYPSIRFEFINSYYGGLFPIHPLFLEYVEEDLCDEMLWSNQIVDAPKKILLLQLGKCSFSLQMEKLEASSAGGFILGRDDVKFLYQLGKEESYRTNNLPVPVVLVSASSFDSLIEYAVDGNAISFEAKDAYIHHWKDLLHLNDPSRWPQREADRLKLLHRMSKSHDTNPEVVRSERYDCLLENYLKAQQHYEAATT